MNSPTNSNRLNQKYLTEFLGAAEDSVFGRLKTYRWNHFLEGVDNYGYAQAFDVLDEFMRKGNEEFRKVQTVMQF